MRLYLVTGFLGAGKTSLVRSLLELLMEERVYVIVNEFGPEGVDGALLARPGLELREVCSGSIFCSCRLDQFEAALAGAVAAGADAVVVEASGFSNPTNIEKILQQEAFQAIKYMGSICMVDACSFHKVFHTLAVCRKQVSVGDLVLINKIDLVDEARCREVWSLLRREFPYAQLESTTFGRLDPAWLARLGLRHGGAGGPRLQPRRVDLRSRSVQVSPDMPQASLVHFLEMAAASAYRIKGFVVTDGLLRLVDCVGERISVTPYQGPVGKAGRLVILFGANQSAETCLAQAMSWYSPFVSDLGQGGDHDDPGIHRQSPGRAGPEP